MVCDSFTEVMDGCKARRLAGLDGVVCGNFTEVVDGCKARRLAGLDGVVCDSFAEAVDGCKTRRLAGLDGVRRLENLMFWLRCRAATPVADALSCTSYMRLT